MTVDRTTAVPAEVAAAFAEAAAEAIRNSIQHAGTRPHRRVVAQIGERSIVLEVVDDGVGFDPSSLPPHRLGIAVSIRGRLAAIPGGSATITSVPGDGTIVRLEWSS